MDRGKRLVQVRAFFEVKLPRRRTSKLGQPLASELEIIDMRGMEDQGKSGDTGINMEACPSSAPDRYSSTLG